MIDWLFYQQYHFANACSQGRKKFVIYDGDGIPNDVKLYFFFSGKVVSVYLLTDRNYVSKSAVILEFICYLRRGGWNFRVSGILHSRKVVNNRY